MYYNNPLIDKEFLSELDENRDRVVYARIIALTFSEDPIELIEGTVTGGSINIDGASSVRRTCSLTLVSKDININDFYWGLKSKFKLEIGLKNTVDTDKYPEIIWFPMGTYVINGFNTSRSTNNCTISISGKDKMCLLNGELGGNLIASIDFGTEEYVNVEKETITYVKIPIEKIIREALHAYAQEPYHNIIINDLDTAAVELLEYRGDKPLYLLRNVLKDEFENFTDNGSAEVYFINDLGETVECTLETLENDNIGGHYDARVELAPEAQLIAATEVIFEKGNSNTKYTIAKLEYGQTAGYRETELTYAGDLISNIGESLTSILDKIKNMLGEYEYFYDVDGRFIFQKKPTYIYNSWNGIVNAGDDEYIDNSAYSSAITYQFEGNKLITSFQNSPVLNNLKNDYSVWGKRESISGEEIPIHYRYAIDTKPSVYISLNITSEDIEDYNNKHGEEFKLHEQTSVRYDTDQYDWRELIYRMAEDYYHYNQLDCYTTRLIEANSKYDNEGLHEGEEPLYQTGKTGYEQYYIDLEGFWRQLYHPEAEPEFLDYYYNGSEEEFTYDDVLFINEQYEAVDIDNVYDYNHKELYALMEINGRYELHPWLEAIYLPEYLDEEYYTKDPNGLDTDIEVDKFSNYFYYISNKDDDKIQYSPIAFKTKGQYLRGQIYVKENDNYIPLIKSSYAETRVNFPLYRLSDNKTHIKVKDSILFDKIYYNGVENKYKKYKYVTALDLAGEPIENGDVVKTQIKYYTEYYNYIKESEDATQLYWTKDLLTKPDQLNFWFDFLDAESELGQFSVSAVGDRTKVVNDNDVKAIYFRQVPNLIFTTVEEYKQSDIKDKTGYTPVFVNNGLENMFNISSQGKSAQERINELLYNHSYCVENVTIQSIPIYYLQPNTRIFVRDDESKVNGEYIINKLTIPLQYNGLMSITAFKAPTRIL